MQEIQSSGLLNNIDPYIRVLVIFAIVYLRTVLNSIKKNDDVQWNKIDKLHEKVDALTKDINGHLQYHKGMSVAEKETKYARKTKK